MRLRQSRLARSGVPGARAAPFSGRIVGELDTKAGRRQIKAVLFQGWLAWRLRSGQFKGAKQQHGRRKQAQGPEAMDPKEMPVARCDRPDDRCWHCKNSVLGPACFCTAYNAASSVPRCVDAPRMYLGRFRDQQSECVGRMSKRSPDERSDIRGSAIVVPDVATLIRATCCSRRRCPPPPLECGFDRALHPPHCPRQSSQLRSHCLRQKASDLR